MTETAPPNGRDRSDIAASSLSGTNLERAGDYNQRVVLQAIRINGPVTRAELARTTGLTAPAIANITRRLIQDGLVADAGKRHGGRGQPATKLVIHPDGCFSLGVNIDRDHVTALALDLQGQVRARATREAPLDAPVETAERVRAMLAELLGQPALKGARVIGLGVALPDALGHTDLPDFQHQTAWAEIDVRQLFTGVARDLLGSDPPVFVENDAAAAAVGELQFGFGLQFSSFFYVLISAGLGGGLVVEGEYFRGANGRSGEIGFLPIHSDRTPARSLQEAVSLSALSAELGRHGISIASPGDLDQLDEAGKRQVDVWLELAAELLTEPLMTVSWLVNPAAILLGGRLPAVLADRLAERLTQRLNQRGGQSPILPQVRRAAMAEDAPAIGASILPFLAQLLPSRSNLLKISD
ncbi:MAG: ROK family transcriptional regulator [Caulobacteraceae bacterium]